MRSIKEFANLVRQGEVSVNQTEILPNTLNATTMAGLYDVYMTFLETHPTALEFEKSSGKHTFGRQIRKLLPIENYSTCRHNGTRIVIDLRAPVG